MAEATQFLFTYKELAEMMARHVGLSEGLWGIYIRFGIQGANAGLTSEDLKPTAIVPILDIGLQRFEAPSNLTVDAATLSESRPRRRRRQPSPTEAT